MTSVGVTHLRSYPYRHPYAEAKKEIDQLLPMLLRARRGNFTPLCAMAYRCVVATRATISQK